MASVIIHGFESDAAAKEFIRWYEGQGEQEIGVWWEDRKNIGKTPYTDMDKFHNLPKVDDEGNHVLYVKN